MKESINKTIDTPNKIKAIIAKDIIVRTEKFTFSL